MRVLLASAIAGLLLGACTTGQPPPDQPSGRTLAPTQPRVAAPCRASGGLRCIAVVPAGNDPATVNAATLIADDLARSQRFAVLRDQDFASADGRTEPAQWQGAGVEYVAMVSFSGDRTLKLRLEDVARPQTLLAQEFPLGRFMAPRAVAHQAADAVFERLTGVRGIAATSIAYVDRSTAKGATQFRLLIADADGANLTVLAESREPILSPAWSPDGSQLAYMGYDNGPPAIFLRDLRSGSVRKLLSEATDVGAPSWSPDGRQIAFTLNGRGGSDIYVLDLASGTRRQLTQAPGIDTEPAWSPDGRTIAFTSDRGGSPQIYTVPATGGAARSLGRLGRQSLRPCYSPDGRSLAMVVLEGSRFRIGLVSAAGGRVQLLSDGPGDESPSFSPNGAMLLYISGGGELIARPIDGGGGAPRRIREGANVRAAAWSPYRTRHVPLPK